MRGLEARALAACWDKQDAEGVGRGVGLMGFFAGVLQGCGMFVWHVEGGGSRTAMWQAVALTTANCGCRLGYAWILQSTALQPLGLDFDV